MAGFLCRAGPLSDHRSGKPPRRAAPRGHLLRLARHGDRPGNGNAPRAGLRAAPLPSYRRPGADRAGRERSRRGARQFSRGAYHAQRRDQLVRDRALSRPHRHFRAGIQVSRTHNRARQPEDRHAAGDTAVTTSLLVRGRAWPGHPREAVLTKESYSVAAGWVYFLANRPNGILYAGVTDNLIRRVWEHREGVIDGFTKQYGLKRLIYFER